MALDVQTVDASLAAQPRAVGLGRVSARLRDGRTRLAGLRQQGSARIFLPRCQSPFLEAVLLNTAGGLTGGDRFSWMAEAGEGTALSLTTQAAERAYRAQPGQIAETVTRLTLGPGARLDWLAQETILFDGAALSRRIEADLAPDARLLLVEPLVFGRTARGERLTHLSLSDHWRVRRAGRLVHADAVHLSGDAEAAIARPAVLAGNRALASLVLVAPEAEAAALLEPLRAVLPVSGGASLIRPGVLAARIAAPDGMALRRALVPAIGVLRTAPLPRPWSL